MRWTLNASWGLTGKRKLPTASRHAADGEWCHRVTHGVPSKIILAKEDMSRHHTYLNARRWATARRIVFKRDGYRCVMCGLPGRLECDHVTPLQREPGQDPFDVNGLQTLCRLCHIEKTATENRRELTADELAWRELVAELA